MPWIKILAQKNLVFINFDRNLVYIFHDFNDRLLGVPQFCQFWAGLVRDRYGALTQWIERCAAAAAGWAHDKTCFRGQTDTAWGLITRKKHDMYWIALNCIDIHKYNISNNCMWVCQYFQMQKTLGSPISSCDGAGLSTRCRGARGASAMGGACGGETCFGFGRPEHGCPTFSQDDDYDMMIFTVLLFSYY